MTLAQLPEASPAYKQIRNAPFERTSLTNLPQSIPAIPHVDLVARGMAIEPASLISSTADSEFPQATGFLQGEVITQTEAISESQNDASDPTSVKSANVVVQPPMIQPYKKNQYSFVIENRGEIDAEDVTIELGVDENSRIVAMLPNDAVVTDQTALLNIKKLHAGEHVNIHLTATSKTESPIKFSARLAHASEQEFGAATAAPRISVAPTQQHTTTNADPYTLQALPVSAPTVKVPVIPTAPTFKPRPDFQTNPHFQGQPSATALINNPLHPRTPFHSVSSGGLTTSIGPVTKRPRATIGDQAFVPRNSPIMESFSSDDLIEDNLDDESEEVEVSIEPTLIDTPTAIAESTPTVSPFEGPRNMQQASTRGFSLNISNPTDNALNDVLVQLRIPAGMQIMTFDRETWFDEESGTVSFRIPRIKAGGSEPVHYQLKAIENGFQIQKLLVEAEGLVSEPIRFDTFVRD